FLVIAGVSAAVSAFAVRSTGNAAYLAVALAGFLVAAFVAVAVRIAAPWERAIVLRLGRYQDLRGPGLFVIIPIVDTISHWIDTRVIATGFKAEKTLTRDTVPVDVDAVLFWKVI